MSDSTPQPAGPDQPTRQQLDELEALMERMLALPVHPALEDALPQLPPPPPVVVERPAAASPVSVPVRAVEAAPPPSLPPAAPVPATPEAKPAPVIELPPPLPPPPPVVTTVRPARPQQLPARPAPAPVVRAPRPPSVWWVRPFLLVNYVFDRSTRPFGRAGAWLRAPVGRAWLGALGALFIAAAVAWVLLDLSGWTW